MVGKGSPAIVAFVQFSIAGKKSFVELFVTDLFLIRFKIGITDLEL
jgi:hypothetical protein